MASPKIGVGIIGCGGIATANHLPALAALHDSCSIVGVTDLDPVKAKEVAQRFGTVAFADQHKLLEDARVEAVIVATPNAAHLEPTLDALRSGRHVLCEKPLGMNAQEAQAMVEASKASGALLQVGLQLRFSSVGRLLCEYAAEERFGHVYFARAQALRRRGVPSWGVFIEKEKQGGGPLLDLGVHILDLTLCAMGYPKPVSASARTWDFLGKNPELFNASGDYDRSRFTIEDMAAGFVTFENGAALSIECSFMANLPQNVYQTQLFGTKAGAIVKPIEPGLHVFTEENRQLLDLTPPLPSATEEPHVSAMRAFLEAIQSGGPSPIPGEQGLVLNATIDALYRSAESGREEAV